MANAFARAVVWPTDVSWQVAFAFLWLDWVELYLPLPRGGLHLQEILPLYASPLGM
jgi:hypothetical protein